MSGVLETPPNLKTNEEDKYWEKAMSTAQIRQHSQNWSLADDAALLNYLQEFSQKLISKTHEMEKSIDGLVQNAKVTTVLVNNVINDFHMLSNSQFIENRVYDEESPEQEMLEVKPPEKSKEELELELVPRISQALKFGLSMVQENFDTIQVKREDSDSEDEDRAIPLKGETILEAKNSYQYRPLPHIIGTPEFHKDDLVGLSYLLSDEEDMEEEEEEEAEEDIKKLSTPPTLAPQLNGHLSSSEEEFIQPPKVKEPHRTVSESSESLFEEEAVKKSKEVEDLFKPAVYDEEEDQFSPFSKRDDNLFRPKGTFIDAEEEKEEDLFGNEVVTNGDVIQGTANLRKDAPNLEGGDGEDLFRAPNAVETPRKPSLSASKPTQEKGGLFDSDEEGDALFGTTTKPKKEGSIVEETETPKDTPKSVDTPKLPPGAVSALGSAFTLELGAALLKKQGKPSAPITADASEVGSGSSTPSATKRDGSSSQSSNSLFTEEQEDHAVIPSRPNPKSIFDDDDEEEADLFSTSKLTSSRKTSVLSISSGNVPAPDVTSKTNQLPQPSKKEEKLPRKVSLFDDDDDDDDELFNFSSKNSTRKTTLSTPIATKPSSNLFDDIEEEDSLFTSPKQVKEEKPITNQASKVPPFKPATKVLEEEPSLSDTPKPIENEIVNKPATTKDSPKKPIGGFHLFGGIDPLAGRKPALQGKEDVKESPSNKVADDLPSDTLTNVPSRPTTLSPLKSKPSLFDSDEFDDDSSLFSAPSMKEKTKPKVDLFTDHSTATLFSDGEEEKRFSKSTKSFPKNQNGSLFSDDDDDELFSTRKDDSEKMLFGDSKTNNSKLDSLPNRKSEEVNKYPKENSPVSQATNIFPEKTITQEKVDSSKNLNDKLISTDASTPPSTGTKIPIKAATESNDIFDLDSVVNSHVSRSEAADLEKDSSSKDVLSIKDDLSDTSKGKLHEKEETPEPQREEWDATKSSTSSPLGFSPIKVLPTLVDGKLSLDSNKNKPIISHADGKSSGLSSKESPSRQPTTSIISFDKPADTTCQLTSMSKDRVHGQRSRRLPSRRGRQAAIMQPSPSTEEEDLLSPLSLPPTSQEDLPASSSSQQASFLPSEPTPSSTTALFDTAPSASPVSKSKAFRSEPPPFEVPDHQDEDDLFGTPKLSLPIQKEATPIPKQTSTSSSKEDLGPSLPQASSTTSSKFDLFGVEAQNDKASTPSAEVQTKSSAISKLEEPSKKSNIFSDDEADIFSSKPPPPPLVKGASRTSSLVSRSKDVFTLSDDDSDDDLFNISSKPSGLPKKDESVEKITQPSEKTISSKSKLSLPRKTTNIFDDDDEDDDIFSTLPSKSSKQITNKPNKFLFDDDLGDIFADVPTTPQTSSLNKRSTSLSQKTPAASSNKKTPEVVPAIDDPLRMGLPET